jgi:hypothetical protein
VAVILPTALTLQQQRAIAAAGKLAPQWSDGIARNICDRLEGDGPWDNATINAAVLSTLNDMGLDSPILP